MTVPRDLYAFDLWRSIAPAAETNAKHHHSAALRDRREGRTSAGHRM